MYTRDRGCAVDAEKRISILPLRRLHTFTCYETVGIPEWPVPPANVRVPIGTLTTSPYSAFLNHVATVDSLDGIPIAHCQEIVQTHLTFDYTLAKSAVGSPVGTEYRVFIFYERGVPFNPVGLYLQLFERVLGGVRHNSPLRVEAIDLIIPLYDEIIVLSPYGCLGDHIHRHVEMDFNLHTVFHRPYPYDLHDAYRLDYVHGALRLLVFGSRYNPTSVDAGLDFTSCLTYDEGCV